MLVKVIAILGVIKPCTCSYTRTLRFLIPCILTHSVNLSFGLNRASKMNVGLGPGSGFKIKPVYNSGLEVLGDGPLKSKFSRSKTCVSLVSRASFEWTKGGDLLTFFTLRNHLSYVSERKWKVMVRTKRPIHATPGDREQNEGRTGGVLEGQFLRGCRAFPQRNRVA